MTDDVGCWKQHRSGRMFVFCANAAQDQASYRKCELVPRVMLQDIECGLHFHLRIGENE